MQIIAILAGQQLAVHADVFQDYSDMYDAMVTNAMSASLKEVPAMTLQESHVAVALICRSRRKHMHDQDLDLLDTAEKLQMDCRLALEGVECLPCSLVGQLHFSVSGLQISRNKHCLP